MLTLLAAPAEPLLSLAEAKQHLRVDHDDEDLLIGSYVLAVGQHLDGATGRLGRALVTQQWRLTLPAFPGRAAWWADGRFWDRSFGPVKRLAALIRLPLPPIQSVQQIRYFDEQGAQQTVDPAVYRFSPALDGVLPIGGSWSVSTLDAPDAVQIDFTCGYGDDAASVPEPIRHAGRLFLSHFYLNREAVVGVENRDSSTLLPAGVEALLAGYRVHEF